MVMIMYINLINLLLLSSSSLLFIFRSYNKYQITKSRNDICSMGCKDGLYNIHFMFISFGVYTYIIIHK